LNKNPLSNKKKRWKKPELKEEKFPVLKAKGPVPLDPVPVSEAGCGCESS